MRWPKNKKKVIALPAGPATATTITITISLTMTMTMTLTWKQWGDGQKKKKGHCLQRRQSKRAELARNDWKLERWGMKAMRRWAPPSKKNLKIEKRKHEIIENWSIEALKRPPASPVFSTNATSIHLTRLGCLLFSFFVLIYVEFEFSPPPSPGFKAWKKNHKEKRSMAKMKV